MTSDEAGRLGWSIARGPNRTIWTASRYGTVLMEPTRQRLLREIERFERHRPVPGL